ncbi:hypothetical protein ACTUVK_002001 [Stenotrophomonas rhizophila]|jgi:hypothetical protein|uniref:hypothetical protein n=1 Tax=Stenotrophomonas sp. BIGb0135 TaxID=2940620 RepID=UPI0021675463|nr:hypothetical protein [Stenotrophomonas sp. BIGb0135]MCS4234389.1 hypothetical protein [Stenotrophomonas sp. BIGb0135]
MRQGIVRRVAEMALRIEPNRTAVLDWILHTPLPSLGMQTTFELACNGEGERVIALLNDLLLQPGDTVPRLPQAAPPALH